MRKPKRIIIANRSIELDKENVNAIIEIVLAIVFILIIIDLIVK